MRTISSVITERTRPFRDERTRLADMGGRLIASVAARDVSELVICAAAVAWLDGCATGQLANEGQFTV